MNDKDQNTELVFPTLTEVVQVPRYTSAELPDNLADIDWADLAQRVRENVFERLTRRSEQMLEPQLSNTLEAITARACESLASELNASLSQMIRDVVARSVNEELTRLHTEIQRRKPTTPNP
jgi:uncharacterized membrane-anchored protein YjiN (DUF445 family)